MLATAQDNATIIFVIAAIFFLIAAVVRRFTPASPQTDGVAIAVGLIFLTIGLIIMVRSGALFGP